MDKKYRAKLGNAANQMLKGIYSSPCSIMEQRAIDVLSLLKDGRWWSSTKIGKELNLSPKYVLTICQACKHGWGLESVPGRGFRLPQKPQK